MGSVFAPWPRSSIDPDRSKSGTLCPFDVSDEVVADHPATLGEAGSAPLGGDLEQTGLGFPDALDSRHCVAVDRVGQASLLELAELVVRHAVRDDPHPPSGGAQIGHSRLKTPG
jgi:hypothetical protein